MVKIHLEWLERSSAIGARNAAQFAEERQDRVLSSAHSGDLSIPVSRVVRGVGSPLIPTS